MIVDALRRILTAQDAAPLPVLDSQDLPRFASPADWPLDAAQLRALAEATLDRVEQRRAGLPDERALAQAGSRLAALRAQLESRSLMQPQRRDIEAQAATLASAHDMHRMVADRLAETEAAARGALRQAIAWLDVDREVKAAARRLAAADSARAAAAADAQRFEAALSKAEQSMQALAAALAPIEAERDDLRAEQAAGGAIDAARLDHLAAEAQRAQRAIDEQAALLAAIERRAAAADAQSEQASAEHAAAQAELARLEKVRRERDIRQAGAAVAELLRARMPHAGAEAFDRMGDWRAALDRAAAELVRR